MKFHALSEISLLNLFCSKNYVYFYNYMLISDSSFGILNYNVFYYQLVINLRHQEGLPLDLHLLVLLANKTLEMSILVVTSILLNQK